jgi:pyroglutamyl-peptidase
MNIELPLRILLTGFRPYDGMARNPTEQLMRRAPEALADIPGVALRAIVLDTDYELSEQQFTAALDDFRPDVVLSFGLSRRIDEIKLERVAINVDDASIPDNSGRLRRGQPIIKDGPVGYWGTIPIDAILQALHDAGIPAGISNHAGAYVCNHIYYFGLHTIATRGLPTRMGFIHVPPLPEMVADEPNRTGMSMETLIKAARVIITTAAEPIRQG